MYYRIKEKTVEEPLVELPKGSHVVSVTHECAQEMFEEGPNKSRKPRFFRPEHWTVVYLEPVSAGKLAIERMKGGGS